MPRKQLEILRDLFVAYKENNRLSFIDHADEYVRYLKWKKFGFKALEFEKIINDIKSGNPYKNDNIIAHDIKDDKSPLPDLFGQTNSSAKYQQAKSPYVWQISKGAQLDFMQAAHLIEQLTLTSYKIISSKVISSILGYTTDKAEGFSRILFYIGLLEDKTRKPTSLAKLIFNNDKYFDDIGTLWFLHYYISSNDKLVIWSRISNFLFSKSTFNYADVVSLLDDQRNFHTEESFRTHLRKEYKTCVNAYIESSFNKLNIISTDELKEIFTKAKTSFVPDDIFLAATILFKNRYYPSEVALEIKLLANAQNSPGKLFYMNDRQVRDALDRLRMKGLINVESMADLDQIKFVKYQDYIPVLEKYYSEKYL